MFVEVHLYKTLTCNKEILKNALRLFKKENVFNASFKSYILVSLISNIFAERGLKYDVSAWLMIRIPRKKKNKLLRHDAWEQGVLFFNIENNLLRLLKLSRI